ncbi:hypothetical protein TYRP_012258 [Tyrophagus putrescentiae]|nr:hypothetical protein TYRP_012258 [Tyrophagus putrescentiae]
MALSCSNLNLGLLLGHLKWLRRRRLCQLSGQAVEVGQIGVRLLDADAAVAEVALTEATPTTTTTSTTAVQSQRAGGKVQC